MFNPLGIGGKMKTLLERLQYHTQRIVEDWHWVKVNNTDTEYAVNPLPKEYWQFLREKRELRAINDIKGNWYFWSAENGIHAQFAKKILGFDIRDLSTSFKHHMYQIRIDRNNQIDHYLFSQLIGFFEYEEYTFEEIKQYMKKLFQDLASLKPYHITLSNKAYAMCKEIITGEAFE